MKSLHNKNNSHNTLSQKQSQFKLQFLLLHCDCIGRLVVFCAHTELLSLYRSEYIVCDGTFEMAPTTSYQLYTFYGFVNGEAMALAWALLPNKTQATYVELLTALRSAMVSVYGDAGGAKTFLVDFELTAVNAIKEVFPESVVKGCSFHFRQALYRHVQSEGLAREYEQPDSVIRGWLRQVLAMSALPAFAIPLVWQWLQVPPAYDPIMYAKAVAFASYVDRTWIRGDFPPSLWSHYDNLGPRTTNVAEGWHNGLNSRFGMPHPSLRVFLNWLQKAQYETQCRGIQLAAGRSPKPRKAAYVNVDSQMWSAKLQYSVEIGKVFCGTFPHPSTWYQFYDSSVRYLNHVSHLLGCN